MNSIFGDRRTILILLGPALLFYTLVKLVPALWTGGLALFKGNLITGFRFVGFDNFVRFAHDPVALHAMWFSVGLSLILTLAHVVLGYGLALLYTFVLRHGSAFIRTIAFFPIVLPTVAVGLLFSRLFAYAPESGVVNTVIEVAGGEPVDWFATFGTSVIVLVIMEVWRTTGFYAVLLYSGLVDIPDEIIESARIDGANGLSLVRSIVIPLSLPVLLSTTIFGLNSTLKVFDTVLALTDGGPGTDTTPLTLHMFRTVFSYGDYGYGSSLATILTAICFLVTIAIFNSSRRDITKG
ncbi:MAG: sugar ABC transporter permease [Propionibacteriaceae bacterium]|jgi:multiple sugar transport system permease protein/raffinose/stachyose/melibiose transport system permease protein|nr:sugar ABC transporter permease [Propionibacteriaceae bacterium]